jgi:hypothetical protein
MKLFFFIVIVVFFIKWFKRCNKNNEGSYRSNRTQRNNQRINLESGNTGRNNTDGNFNGANPTSKTYRPTARKGNNSKIIFKPKKKPNKNKGSRNDPDLKGLHDAFTGAPLDESLGLNQCETCKVYYHTESFKILQKENSSKCVACQTAKIIEVVINIKSTGKDYTPAIANLHNYKDYEGKVVTFEGYVYTVRDSSENKSLDVLFTNKLCYEGFRLVFLGNAIHEIGGYEYIKSFKGKTIKVRGLIVKHIIFGYRIMISEKSMILGVS